MVPSCDKVDSGIRVTQVGDPLVDGRDGVAHRIRSNRVVVLSAAAVAESADEEAGEPLVVFGEIPEGEVVAEAVTEGLPVTHDPGVGSARFSGGGSRGESKRSAEISGKETSGGRGTRHQGFACG